MTAKSDRVEKLLKDEDLNEAFENVRNRLLSAFTTCKTDDTDMMVDIRKRLHLLDLVKKDLMDAIKDGQVKDFQESEKQRPPFLGDISTWRKQNKQ